MVGEGMVKSLVISDNFENSCIGKGGQTCEWSIDSKRDVTDAIKTSKKCTEKDPDSQGKVAKKPQISTSGALDLSRGEIYFFFFSIAGGGDGGSGIDA